MNKNIIKTTVLMFTLAVFTQISFSQTAAADQKTKLVNELVETTFAAFPTDVFKNTIDEMKKGSLGGFKDEITKTLNSKVDEFTDMPAEKKDGIKTKIPALVDKMAARLEVLVTRDLNLEKWIKESLAEDYAKDLTVDDLRKLTDFFRSPSGKAFFEMVKEEAQAEVEKRPSKSEELLTEKDALVIDKFMKTPAATKFMTTFTKDTDSALDGKINIWGDNMLKSIDVDMENGELGTMLNDFIKENLSEN